MGRTEETEIFAAVSYLVLAGFLVVLTVGGEEASRVLLEAAAEPASLKGGENR